jgi:hypothetical protein
LRSIGSDEDEVTVADHLGCREVDRVISAEPLFLGQLARTICEGSSHFDDVDLLREVIE